MPKFSILTPCHLHSEERRDQLLRAVDSVLDQTTGDWELVLVNDGSTIPFPDFDDSRIKVFEQPHLERIIAYNLAMKNATGKWFCFLDSDDEFDPTYLEKFSQKIKEYPKYKMFNCGSKFIHKDGNESLRGPFEPPLKDVGHEEFGGGNIVNGTFIFHRSVYDKLGAFPPAKCENIDCTELNYGEEQPRNLFMSSPWDFSAMAQIEFPEIRRYFTIDNETETGKIIKEIGNPWGNDYFIFYKYTRKYHSFPFSDNLYFVHLR